MKLQDSQNKHENDKPTKKNNKFFADNQIILCLRGAELEMDSFKNDGSMRWIVPVVYKDQEGIRQSAKLSFGSSPDGKSKWDGTFSEEIDWPAHNVRLAYNVMGDAMKGYHLDFLELPADQCPCHTKLPWQKQTNGHKEQTVDEILADYGFDLPPATDSQKHAIVLLADALHVAVPANLDTLTNQEAEDWIAARKAEHAGVK